MPRTGPEHIYIVRLGILVSLVLLGSLMLIVVPLPSHEFAFVVLNSRLALRFSGAAQLAVIMVVLVCSGVDALIRAHPHLYAQKREEASSSCVLTLAYTATFWMLPSLITIIGLTLLYNLSWWGYQIALAGLTALVFAFVIILQHRNVIPLDARHPSARSLLDATVYVIALIVFVTLYGLRVRSLLSATGVLLSSGMLTLELLRGAGEKMRRTWLYAGLVGILMGELTWALNYCRLEIRIGGGLLLLVFYTLTGLTRHYLSVRSPDHRPNRRVVVEFGVVFAAGLAILVSLARWLP